MWALFSSSPSVCEAMGWMESKVICVNGWSAIFPFKGIAYKVEKNVSAVTVSCYQSFAGCSFCS